MTDAEDRDTILQSARMLLVQGFSQSVQLARDEGALGPGGRIRRSDLRAVIPQLVPGLGADAEIDEFVEAVAAGLRREGIAIVD